MSFSRDNANTNPPTSHPLNTNTPEAQPSDNLTATTSTPTQSILLPSPDPNDPKWSSPGNAHRLNPDTPPMSTPNLSFLYRLECNVSVEEMVVGAPYGAGITRSIVNILDGSLDGPRIKGRVLPGGADWMTTVEGTHVSDVLLSDLFSISFLCIRASTAVKGEVSLLCVVSTCRLLKAARLPDQTCQFFDDLPAAMDHFAQSCLSRLSVPLAALSSRSIFAVRLRPITITYPSILHSIMAIHQSVLTTYSPGIISC